MPHGERAAIKESKKRDYWSARGGNRGGLVRCPYTKERTHKLERIEAKREAVMEIEEYEKALQGIEDYRTEIQKYRDERDRQFLDDLMDQSSYFDDDDDSHESVETVIYGDEYDPDVDWFLYGE